MKKLAEWKNQDWMKGISAQTNVALGGLFQSIYNSDPFEQGGACLPSLSPESPASGISTTPKLLTAFNNGGSNYLYAHTPTKLYQVLKDSPYTVTDQTAQINQSLGGGVTATDVVGRAMWKNKYIYGIKLSNGGISIHANAFPVASGSDVPILAAPFAPDVIPMVVGADLNLYLGCSQAVSVCTRNDGVTGNTAAVAYIDEGFNIRDVISDGRYLVILADNNTLNVADRQVGSYKCKVYFWNMVATTVVNSVTYIDCSDGAVWEFSDSYIIGGKLTDKGIEFFGYNGLYVTNVATEPKTIRPFPSSTLKMGRPINPYQIIYNKGSLYWVDGTTNVNNYIYAYGNPIYGQQKIFYIPYCTGVVGISQCLIASGNNFIVGNDVPSLYFFNVGTTRGALQLTGLDQTLEEPVTYGYTKVVLAQKLTSGQSVQVVAQSNNSAVTLSNETQSYNAANPKQSLLFRRVPSASNQPDKCEDLTISVVANGCALTRVSTYGTPLGDANADL